MNAAEQATSIEMVSKIATIVNLFKASFPDLMAADLSPWLVDTRTVKFEDANSIDIAFHFPRYSPSCRCCSILMQIRLHQETPEAPCRAVGIEASGHDYRGQQWQFSKEREWQFEGAYPPVLEQCTKLASVCHQILKLFNNPVRQSTPDQENV